MSEKQNLEVLVMGCIESCFLHYMKRCGCCICDCCYGPGIERSYCCQHETGDGQTVFNSPFSLILYDKWCKQSQVYHFRQQIFDELSELVIPNKNIIEPRIILDAGYEYITYL